MTMSLLAIILAIIGFVAIFIPRMPAVVISYVALVCAHFAGTTSVDSKSLIFWGLATGIIIILRALQPEALIKTTKGHGYVALATIAGTLLGYLASHTSAAIIIGGATGAFMGAVAYMQTPTGPHLSIASTPFLQYLCAKGLPCIVATTMALISVVSVI
ncbi:MAG: hypothetical protein J1F05_07575 [Muribaculaceae bacterium]|nr:hypothetical protein [Muribaculaceae bacterium]